jgi:hypothetical protein
MALAKPGRLPPDSCSTVPAHSCPFLVRLVMNVCPSVAGSGEIPSAGNSDWTAAWYVAVYAWPAAAVVG